MLNNYLIVHSVILVLLFIIFWYCFNLCLFVRFSEVTDLRFVNPSNVVIVSDINGISTYDTLNVIQIVHVDT